MVVYLVGAGPGDPELITIKAIRLIKKADVLIYDRLVSDAIVCLAPPKCKLIYMGKRDEDSKLSQQIQKDIISVLVKYGHYQNVVRLKGGDPFIFGRGGEEALACVNAGINFEIVPGISSFYAATAYSGIPVSHRNFNSVFAVLTGHESVKAKSDIDWSKLPETIIILMGVSKIQKIAKNLLAIGRDNETPVAAIEWGTTHKQKTLITTLGNLANGIEGLNPPTVFIIGSIVKLHYSLNWFEKKMKAASGKKVILTRARSHSVESEKILKTYDIKPVVMPLIEIVSRDFKIPKISDYDALIFTSLEGVKRVGPKIDLKSFKGLIFAIGPKTRSALLKNYGINAFIGESYNSEGLGIYVLNNLNKGSKVLLLRSSAATKTLSNLLSTKFDITEVYIYDIKSLPADPKLIKGADAVFVMSASCAKSLEQLDHKLLNKTTIVSIGPETSRYLTIQHIIATEHTLEGMISIYLNYLWRE